VAKRTKATTLAFDRIDQLDLKVIVARATDAYGWSGSRPADAEDWYRKFLKLCYLHPHQRVAAIDDDADDLWHQHILDTVIYQRDCNAVFGNYLEHVPIDGPPSAADVSDFNWSMDQYQSVFRATPPKPAFRCVKKPTPPPGPWHKRGRKRKPKRKVASP
jgi:hypothetical protein